MKVEASHLKRLPLPLLATEDLEALDRLGRELTRRVNAFEDVTFDIDSTILKSLGTSDYVNQEKCWDILELNDQLLQERFQRTVGSD